MRQGDPCLPVRGITTDSRLEQRGGLFLALRGEKYDGHQFVTDSPARGAIGALVERGRVEVSLPDAFALIEVDDTLLAYQRIAARYRRTLSAKVVAITGSNGKTSTKDFTAAVMARRFRVLKTEGNFNNHIGVPQTLLRASVADEVIVLEIGMNHPGEIAPLASIAKPDVGIITNIGTAHLEFMGSRAGIAQEKGKLAESIGHEGYVILPAADEFAESIAARTSAQVIRVGGTSGLRAETVEQDFAGVRFTMVEGDERAHASVPVPGSHMVTNALLAVAAGRICGISLTECAAALSDARLTKGRMEQKNVHGFRILDDSYNANPDSMIAAVETLAQMPTAHRRIAVLGKMAELGQASDEGHRRVGEAAAAEKIDCIIGVGPEAALIARSAREAGHPQSLALAGTTQAAEWLHGNARRGDLILLKGSRSAAMEQVLAVLEELFDDTKPGTGAPATADLSHAP